MLHEHLAFLLSLTLSALHAAPNVILMMGDDHGLEETGYHDHPHVKTPVIDAMKLRRVSF